MYMHGSCSVHHHMTFIRYTPLMSFPKPMEDATVWPLLLDFSFRTSSSLEVLSAPCFFFFFLWRGGSFLGKANMGKMTNSMAKAQRRKPLHLRTWRYGIKIIRLLFDLYRTTKINWRLSMLFLVKCAQKVVKLILCYSFKGWNGINKLKWRYPALYLVKCAQNVVKIEFMSFFLRLELNIWTEMGISSFISSKMCSESSQNYIYAMLSKNGMKYMNWNGDLQCYM